MRWFTADPHFGHARILELAHRPFRDVQEMNRAILDRASSVVGPDDELWVLGDLALGTITESLKVASRLPGQKVLILGNHDRPFLERTRERRRRFRAAYEAAGFRVLDELVVADRIGRHDVLLSHYPYEGDSIAGEERHKNLRAVDEGLPIVHGHVHERWHIDGRQINVGVDVNDFTPVSEEQVAEWLDAIRA
jgi:calcineurin-like phosphoesterase family protein